MSTLERAVAIAAQAHEGQKDKAGEPYILHPLRVMLRMHSEAGRIVAVLHDVVEDSEYTLDDIRAEGFTEEVITALAAITKQAGEGRIEAAKRAARHPLARAVKLADNADNADLGRIPAPSAKDLARMDEYRKVRELLE
ncbi:MAG: HD domain-containing protein [Desulfobulbaceae bacterium]|nr:HD domain-containing protein [Desulfobulbaceae bacterium]